MTEKISLKNLSKRFDAILAVDDITLSLNNGEVLGFLGPNGAGKSTTMRMLTGFIEPTSGTAEVCGLDVTRHPVETKRRIGYLPEGAPTYGDMTPDSYLSFIAEIRGFDGAEKRLRVDAVADKVDIRGVLRQPIDTLSKGFKRRVGLAQAMIHDPEILIMDEPTDGLDPNQKHQVRALIHEMAQDKAIIISTHILEEVEAVCSRAVIIAHGRLLADGTPADLLAQAPNHNAVVVTVDANAAGALRQNLEKVPGVASVEDAPAPGLAEGKLRLRAKPEVHTGTGTDIGDAIGAMLRDKSIPVHELFVERGALDDVFRQITAPEGASDA
ncbi:MAG: ABC transporter ATP-binding protein [Rhodospirillales bacterium]|nr:ABC transporter ATP-binding protein [Alphaproteobacteria bacterium]MBL6948122.1 ABC transporter ATP-binding protein [Rhodospirillales bacterium]